MSKIVQKSDVACYFNSKGRCTSLTVVVQRNRLSFYQVIQVQVELIKFKSNNESKFITGRVRAHSRTFFDEASVSLDFIVLDVLKQHETRY